MQSIIVLGISDNVYHEWVAEIVELKNNQIICGEKITYRYLGEINIDVLENMKNDYNVLDILADKTETFEVYSEDTTTPNIMSFGNFIGHDLNELCETEIDYVIWMCDHSETKNSKYAKELPRVKEFHNELLEKKKINKEQNFDFFLEFLAIGEIEFSCESNLIIVDNNLAYLDHSINGHIISFFFELPNFEIKTSKSGNIVGMILINGQYNTPFMKTLKFEYEKYYSEKNEESEINFHVMVKKATYI